MRVLSTILAFGTLIASLLIAGCSQTAAAPTQPPVQPKAAEPTKAPAAAPAQPTAAPAPPTAVPAKKVDFPQKGRSITFIVPYAAGGSTDIGARLLAPGLEEKLGVSVQVVNKAGAASQLGITELVNSKPDGYTIGMITIPAGTMTYLDAGRKATYGRKDLVQVANQVVDPEQLIVKSDSPFKTLKDLVDAAKANPEKITVVDDGLGGVSHLTTLQVEKAAGVKFRAVHLDGGGPAMVALEGGHVDVAATTLGTIPTQLKRGAVRILGIMEKERNKFAPEAPTFEEQGYKLYFASSRGIGVPPGTPKEIIDVLSAAVKDAMNKEDAKKKMDEAFLTQRYMDAAEYTAYWDEMEKQVRPLVELIRAEPSK